MSFPRQAIVVQARLQSSRLPGKVMREIAGKPLLENLIDRINLDTIDWPLIISTSSLKYDDPIYDFCAVKRIECFRGSHQNVESRFHEVCKKFNLDAFLRISADSPMMDGSLVSQLIGYWRSTVDLLSNIYPRTYPKGQSLEIINSWF
jgi:spore coat polysaccharide biosynthesis protein SpsF